MQVQIIESNRDRKIAVHDGHSYNQKQTTINCIRIHWRCTKCSLKCPAILKTRNESVIETSFFPPCVYVLLPNKTEKVIIEKLNC